MIHLEECHQGYTNKKPISIKRKKIIHLMCTQNGEPSQKECDTNAYP